MGEFKIHTNEAEAIGSEFDEIARKLSRLENRLYDAVPKKGLSSGGLAVMQENVKACATAVGEEKSSVTGLNNQLCNVLEQYRFAEQKIENDIIESMGISAVEEEISIGASFVSEQEKVSWSDFVEQALKRGVPGATIAEWLLYAENAEDDSVLSRYWNEFSEYIENKTKEYFDRMSAQKDGAEVLVEWYDWVIGDLYGGVDSIATVIENFEEERTWKKPELLGKAGEFFDTLSDYGILIDVTKEIKSAYETGEWSEAYENVGLKIFKKVLKKGNKYLDKRDNLKYLGVDKQSQSVLLNTIIKMPEKWIEGVKDYAENGVGTAGNIFTETVVGSTVESIAGAAKPYYILGTAVTYPVVDGICEALGYDLSGNYERLTGKTGLVAVLTAQKELWVDIVYEGAKEKISAGVDGFYEAVGDAGSWIADTAKKGWSNWKSGIKRIFGG